MVKILAKHFRPASHWNAVIEMCALLVRRNESVAILWAYTTAEDQDRSTITSSVGTKNGVNRAVHFTQEVAPCRRDLSIKITRQKASVFHSILPAATWSTRHQDAKRALLGIGGEATYAVHISSHGHAIHVVQLATVGNWSLDGESVHRETGQNGLAPEGVVAKFFVVLFPAE